MTETMGAFCFGYSNWPMCPTLDLVNVGRVAVVSLCCLGGCRASGCRVPLLSGWMSGEWMSCPILLSG